MTARPKNSSGQFVKAEEEAAAPAENPAPPKVSNERALELFEVMMGKLEKMEKQQADLLDANAQLAAELDETQARHTQEMRQLAELAAKKAAAGEINALPPEANNSMLRGDRPGNIEEELNAREVLARENKQPFDRERVRAILTGQPVEDLNKWMFNGHAFETRDEMELYKIMVERQIAEQAGKYSR